MTRNYQQELLNKVYEAEYKVRKKEKEQLLKEYFDARDKAFNLEIEHQIAEWEVEAAYKRYIACLRAEKQEAAAND